MVAADRQHRSVPDIAIHIDRHVGRAAAHIADHHAHLALGLVQHHFGGGQRVEHKLRDFHAGSRHALAQVFHAGSRGGDDVRLDFQAIAVHADRHVNAILPIHVEAALDDMDDLAVMRDGHGPGRIHRPADIIRDRSPARTRPPRPGC